MFDPITTLPFAVASAAAFYVLLLAALFPGPRQWVAARIAMPTPTTRQYMAPLEVYRGLAALLVAIAHSWQFTYPIFASTQREWMQFLGVAAKGVPIFTILSGFLIYRSVQRISDLPGLTGYLRNRLVRIYPAYLLTVVLCIVLGHTPWTIAHIVGEVFMLRAVDLPWFTNRPAWSLYVELIFYLTVPAFVLLVRRNTLLWSLVGFVVCAAGDAVPALPAANPHDYVLLTTQMGAWLWKYFFAGIIASELYDRLAPRIGEGAALGIFIAGWLLMLLDFRGDSGDWISWLGLRAPAPAGYTIGLAVASVLIIVGSCCSRLVSGSLHAAVPLRMLGVVSYSLFLLHPVFLAVCVPELDFKIVHVDQPLLARYGTAPAWYLPFVVMPGQLFWATVSFLAVERPFLALRETR